MALLNALLAVNTLHVSTHVNNNSVVNSPCLFQQISIHLSDFFFVNLFKFSTFGRIWLICILIEYHTFARFKFVYTMLHVDSHYSFKLIHAYDSVSSFLTNLNFNCSLLISLIRPKKSLFYFLVFTKIKLINLNLIILLFSVS